MKMTEQEAWELDDLLTRTDPEFGPNGSGYFSRRKAETAHTITIDRFSANYLNTKAMADHKTPGNK